MSWTEEVFIHKYKDKLNEIQERNRGDGFLAIFKALEAKIKPIFNIVETGSMRPNFNMAGDGQSTKLFDEFVNFYRGAVITVDLDKETSEFADKNTSHKTVCYNEDSVNFLWSLDLNSDHEIDLFYLDSYDVDFNNPLFANLHHIKELVAIARAFKPGTLIAVDDCRFFEGDVRIPKNISHTLVGKGVFVENFMQNIGATLLFDGYQQLWQIN